MTDTALLATLTETLGTQAVLTGDDVSSRARHVWDPTTIDAAAIVRPRDTAELAEVLRLCHAARQPVVAHGGRTGLTHAHDTTAGDVILSLERMTRIEDIDVTGRTATVQAGVPLAALQEAASAEGLFFPVDLGARGSCTVGGNIATNAGGNRVIRYGMMRDSTLGLEAVLADGTVMSSLNRMIKNNAGYDLKQLFIGSEGTLGIVSRATLRLREAPRSTDTAFVAVDSFEALTALLKFADHRLGGTLGSFEVMWNAFYRLVSTPPATSPPPLPQHHPYYVLIESLGADPALSAELFETTLAAAMEAGIVADAVIARSDADRAALWKLRDDVEQGNRFAPIFIYDVSLPIAAMDSYVNEVKRRLDKAYPEHQCFVFGHLGDGNLHLNIAVGDGSPETHHAVNLVVYEPLRALHGSVSAEHGIGLEKKPYLSITRSDSELAVMRCLKRALDPDGILNPGKIFDC